VEGYSQLQTYKDEVSDLLAYNVALVIYGASRFADGHAWNTIKNENGRPLLE